MIKTYATAADNNGTKVNKALKKESLDSIRRVK